MQGLRLQDLEFRIQGLGLRVQDLGSRIDSLGLLVWVHGGEVPNLGIDMGFLNLGGSLHPTDPWGLGSRG